MTRPSAQNIGSLLSDIYDAWRAHNLEWLASYLPDDFSHRINIPPTVHPLGGERVGKQAALERLRQIFTDFETTHLITGQVEIVESKAALEVTTSCVHRQTGTPLDTKKRNVWTLEDGWPTRLEEDYDLKQFEIFMNAARR